MLNKDKKQKVIQDSQTHEKDTGSPEVQVSVLTERINELSRHLKKNKKDKHSRRGLLGMVSKRKKHLKYLERKDPERFDSLSKKIKK